MRTHQKRPMWARKLDWGIKLKAHIDSPQKGLRVQGIGFRAWGLGYRV